MGHVDWRSDGSGRLLSPSEAQELFLDLYTSSLRIETLEKLRKMLSDGHHLVFVDSLGGESTQKPTIFSKEALAEHLRDISKPVSPALILGFLLTHRGTVQDSVKALRRFGEQHRVECNAVAENVKVDIRKHEENAVKGWKSLFHRSERVDKTAVVFECLLGRTKGPPLRRSRGGRTTKTRGTAPRP